MTDYLALIAAKTIICPDRSSRYPAEHEHPCDTCKGLGYVLDVRFEGLREDHNGKHSTGLSAVRCENRAPYCPGYTVVRDLVVLLEIAKEVCHATLLQWSVKNNQWEGWVQDDTFKIHTGLANTPLEAAAKAVWAWLEAEEKVMI